MRSEFSLTNPSLNNDKHGDNSQSARYEMRIIWGVMIAVVLSLIGLSWYGYSRINGNGALIAEIPGLQKLASTMGDRLSSLDGKLNEWRMDRSNLTARMDKLEKTAASNLKTARSQAQSLANEVSLRIRQQMAEELQRLQGRVANVESVQRESEDHVSQLQAELGNVRQEMAKMQQQNAEHLAEVQQAAQAAAAKMNNQMTTMQNQVVAHTDRLQALGNEVDRERTAFQLSNNETRQIVTGIYVTVSHTDVAHQKVDGWMQIADEGRIVWIHGLPAQQALTFATHSDNRTHELVFTAVNESGAAGYVLLPTSKQSPALTSN